METKKGLKPSKVLRSKTAERKYFRVVIAYKGTHYRGWQKQAKSGGPETIQELLEKAAKKILKKKRVIFHASGRTDAGVHARAQVAHFSAEVDLPASTIIKAINAHLPEDIRILKMEECSPDFHSQLDAKTKTYRYFILNTHTGKDPIHWPFLRPYTWFVSYPLNFDHMKSALAQLEGNHDFKSFQNRGTILENTEREILEAKLVIHQGNPREIPPWMPGPEFEAKLLEIRIQGSGFLKQMVRNIVGTLVDIGRGRNKPEEILLMLAKKDRIAAGMTAPANALFLDHVSYDEKN
jgi:tRNA pseudouridine38-40 synthase